MYKYTFIELNPVSLESKMIDNFLKLLTFSVKYTEICFKLTSNLSPWDEESESQMREYWHQLIIYLVSVKH